MNVEDELALIHIRHVYVNLSVKTSSPHQCLVQNVRTVGRCQDDDPTVGSKTIHLSQQLIQGVLSLIVGTKVGILAACPSNGINLVDENDGR